MTRNPAITYRPDPELRERLQRYADARRWSLNTAITAMIETCLDTEEAGAPLINFGREIANPGEPSKPLSAVLAVDGQPDVQEQLREDLEAIRDAERRAESETKEIRLH